MFPITKLPLGPSPSTGRLIYSANDRADFFAGEVVVKPSSDVSPRRFQEIVKEINYRSDRSNYKSGKSGSDPRPVVLTIKGYIPAINTYLVELAMSERDMTFGHQAINRVIRSFLDFKEVSSTSPNYKVTPAATPPLQWYLKSTPGIDGGDLDQHSELGRGKGVGIAIIDLEIDCDEIGKCKFLSPSDSDNSCSKYSYNYVPSPPPRNHHGTDVAKLIAGASTAAADLAGVAHKSTLYPIQLALGGSGGRNPSSFTLSEAITCVGTIATSFGTPIHIVNISMTVANPELREPVCHAVCANALIVASAGGHIGTMGSCIPKDQIIFPADFSDDHNPCGCNKKLSDSVLSVGGTDRSGNLATTADGSNFGKCSFPGNIRAPGWHIPGENPESAGNFGTSWSAALVSGCAAVRAADQIARNRGWNPHKLRNHLIRYSRQGNVPTGDPKVMNCFSAVADPNPDEDISE